MWCGPIAVARLLGKRSGWTKERVWLHIRALREQEGKRLTIDPVGGVYMKELVSVLERAGLAVAATFLPGYTTVAQLRLQQHRRNGDRHFYIIKGDRCVGKARGHWRDVGVLIVQRRRQEIT
jgi:hypothetical protein